MKTEIEGITNVIIEQKANGGKSWSLKQMMIFKANLQIRYDRLFKAQKSMMSLTLRNSV